MPPSTQGFIKIFPSTVSIVSGTWALNSDASPQPSRPAADLEAYYDARVTNLAVAPNLRKATEYPAASGVYVPAIGAYELQFSPSTIDIEFYDSYPGVPTLTASFLDADFPMGLGITQAQLYWNGQVYIGPERDRTIPNVLFKYFGSTIETWTPANGLNTGSHLTPTNAIISNFLINWSFIQLMKSYGFLINVNSTVSASLGIPRAVNSEMFILAAYNISTFSTSTATPNVLPGNIADVSGLNFNRLDQDSFKIYWDTLEGESDVNSTFPGWSGGILIPRNLILEFTSTYFRFIIPNNLGIPYGGRRLMLTGTGNSAFYVGEFPLQNYNITLVDGSGLYTLVEEQRHDTYYDRSVSPVVTTDLKIPDPFVKTGFFPE